MITNLTVFVLGAGVSIPYGFPSGARLLEIIFSQVTSREWTIALNRCGIEDKHINDFRFELNLSQQPSIDAFLEHRQEYLEVGKLSIALALMDLENEGDLFRFDVRNEGVYHYIFNKLNTGWEEFGKNKVAFVTFNYDRSLEHFLYTALKHSYNKPDEEIAQVIGSIPIIHVHGWLGPLPWQNPDGRPYTPVFAEYKSIVGTPSPEASKEAVRLMRLIGENAENASKQIKIVSETQPKTDEFIKAQKLLSQANRIYFLGFGYHLLNLKRLGLKEVNVAAFGFGKWNEQTREMPLSGSALGLGRTEIEEIQKMWKISLRDNTCDALQFLKNYAYLS